MATFTTIHGHDFLIDDDLAEWASHIRWRSHPTRNTVYVVTKNLYLHRIIMRTPEGMVTDHINRNGLDNRRENLRTVDHGVNAANSGLRSNNTTGYRGVQLYKRGYRAVVRHNLELIQSNQLKCIDDAVMMRDEIARQLFGELIFLNWPNQRPRPEIAAEAARLIEQHNRKINHESE